MQDYTKITDTPMFVREVALDRSLDKYVLGVKEAPPFSVELANELLIQNNEAENPKVLWLKRDLMFSLDRTKNGATTALEEDINQDGQWITLFQETCESPDKTILDYFFISSFGWVLRTKELARGVSEQYKSIVDGSSMITNLYNFQDSTSSQNVTRYYSDVEEATELLNLNSEEEKRFTKVVAGRVLDSFMRHKLYLDTGSCRGNEIDVSEERFYEWIPALRTAIMLLTEGSDDEYYIELITEKLVAELVPELIRVNTGMGENFEKIPDYYYDGHIRNAVITLLIGLNVDVKTRKAIYDKIPGFLALPKVGQIIPQNGSFNMQYIESEFSLHNITRSLDTEGLFLPYRWKMEQEHEPSMNTAELQVKGALIYSATDLKALGIDLSALEYEIWYCGNFKQLVTSSLFNWEQHRSVLIQRDAKGITRIAILKKH